MNKHLMNEVKRRILATNGKFFTVIFTKRTDGNTRKMVCRTKQRTGNAPYNADDHFLVHVWDIQVRDWRSIPLEGVTYFKCGAVTYHAKKVADARTKFLRRIHAAVREVDRAVKRIEQLSNNA